MVGEQHFQREFAAGDRLSAHGVDDHAFASGRGASGLQRPRSLDRDHAHAASANIAQVGMMTEGGDFDPGRASGVKDGCAVGGGDGFVVDGEVDGHGTYPYYGVRLDTEKIRVSWCVFRLIGSCWRTQHAIRNMCTPKTTWNPIEPKSFEIFATRRFRPMVADGGFGVFGLAGAPGRVGEGSGPAVDLAIILDHIEFQYALCHAPGVVAGGARAGGVVEEGDVLAVDSE